MRTFPPNLLLLVCLICNTIEAQVSIGTTNPDPSAIFELKSNNKGFLFPRMTTVQRNAIQNPTAGLMIYNTIEHCIQWYNSTAWSYCNGTEEIQTIISAQLQTSKQIYLDEDINEELILELKIYSTSILDFEFHSDTLNGYYFYTTNTYLSGDTLTVHAKVFGNPIVSENNVFKLYLNNVLQDINLNSNVKVHTSCLSWKMNGANTNGIYRIDSDSIGSNLPYDAYCNMVDDGGGWTLVFNHNTAGGYWADNTEADNFNQSNPGITTNKYSILNKIDDFKQDDNYEFRLYYPEFDAYNHWKQTFDPRSGQSPTRPVAGYTPIHIFGSQYYWGGLNRDLGTNTYLDGSVNHHYWYYSIGQKKVWGGGIPSNTPATSQVSLFIR